MSEETIVPKLLTAREVATLLRVHRPKVYELIKFGDLEGFKLGADWRVKTSSVEKYVGQISADMLGFKPSDLSKRSEVNS
jgi:excisionase family DNA binding protein